MRYLHAFLTLAFYVLWLVVAPLLVQSSIALVNDSIIINNDVFAAIEHYYTPQIQASLEVNKSGLASYEIGEFGKGKPASEIIMNASIGFDYMVNPKILLALLESASGVVTEPSPTTMQLDFAMGNTDPTVRGFEKQVNWAAAEIGRAYERYLFSLPSDQRHRAASLALEEFASALPNERIGKRILSDASSTSFSNSYLAIFGVSPQESPDNYRELNIDQLTFLEKPYDDYPTINTNFDHESPNYSGNLPVTIFTDENKEIPYNGHPGYDYGLVWDAPVRAAAEGNIAHAGQETSNLCDNGNVNPNGPAKYVAIDHDLDSDGDPDFRTLYWHLNSNRRSDGQEWEDNQSIEKVNGIPPQVGLTGNTGRVAPCPDAAHPTQGTHLHFEVRADPAIYVHGQSVLTGSAVDPFGWWSTSRTDPGGTLTGHLLWQSTDLVDDKDASFEKFSHSWQDWNEASAYESHAWASSTNGAWAVWGLKAPHDGNYNIGVFIPDIAGRTFRSDVGYAVYYPSRRTPELAESAVYRLDQQALRGRWSRIGATSESTIGLRKGETVLVKLEIPVGDQATYAVADAFRLIPYPIDNGLQYLRTHQRSDGSWGESAGSTGISALVTLAFLNYGFDEHDATDTDVDGTPDIQEAIRYLLSQRRADGSFGESGGLFTYDSALVILVLAAADHTNDPRRYTDQIRQAKDYLLRAQSTEATGYAPDNPNYGGWGYPRENWSDLSNTQWAVMALDAAYSYLGLEKPPADDALAWTGRVLSYADKVQRADGGFDYRQGYFNRSLGSMSHAGIWTNLLAGRNPDTNLQLQNALNWVQTGANWSVSQNPGRGSAALYYYYVTLAKSLAMARKTNLTIGGVNHDWFQELLTELTTGGHQPHADGYWRNSNGDEWESDRHLVTAYAILALETRTLAPNIPLSMSIILHSPADLHLYDAQGRHTGKNYQTGAIDVQIPGSSFVATEPQTIVVDRPVAGNYTVHFVGRDDGGNYEVDILGQQGDAIVSSERLSGVIEANEVQGSFLNVAAIEGTLTIFASEPEVLPVMAVDPASLAFWNRDWVTVERSFTVRETGGQRGIRNLTLFVSDLIGSRGHRLPATTVQVTPAQFDLAAGGSRTVTLRIAIPRGQPVDLYAGRITMESISAGAKAIGIELQVLALSFLPAANNTYVRPANWHSTVGLTNRTVFDLASANNACSTVFAGTDQGIYRSWDTGRSWYLLPVGLEAPFGSDLGFDDPAIPTDNLVPAVVTCPANPSVVYMTRWGEGVFRSTDAGTTWQLRSGGALDRYVYDLAASSFSCDVVFAASGEKGVFETNDGGAYWQARNNGLSNLYTRSLAVAAGNADRLVLGTTSGAYYTMDGGVNWWGGGGLPTETIRALAVAHVDANVVYAGTATRGIYRSTDGGATWQSTNNGLGNVEVRALAIDPFNPQVIYAGRDDGGGVYRTVDGGANWSAFDEDLGSRNIKSLWLDGGSCHTLLAGTTNGVWYFGP